MNSEQPQLSARRGRLTSLATATAATTATSPCWAWAGDVFPAVRASINPSLSRPWSHRATGHWRAISGGVTGSMTVTSGASVAQVRAVRGPDRSDSQADSAGRFPVTRSRHVGAGRHAGAAAKPDFRDLRWSLTCHWRAIAAVAPAVGMLGSAMTAAAPSSAGGPAWPVSGSLRT